MILFIIMRLIKKTITFFDSDLINRGHCETKIGNISENNKTKRNEDENQSVSCDE